MPKKTAPKKKTKRSSRSDKSSIDRLPLVIAIVCLIAFFIVVATYGYGI